MKAVPPVPPPVINRPPVKSPVAGPSLPPPQRKGATARGLLIAGGALAVFYGVVFLLKPTTKSDPPSGATPTSFPIPATPTQYLDAGKLALVPRKTALAQLRSSHTWTSVTPKAAGSEGVTEERIEVAAADGTTGMVFIESGRVAGVNLTLAPRRRPDESLLTVLGIPIPETEPVKFPLGMRWINPSGRFKWINIIAFPKCGQIKNSERGCTVVSVDFLSTNP
jgi:hypothetical protein